MTACLYPCVFIPWRRSAGFKINCMFNPLVKAEPRSTYPATLPQNGSPRAITAAVAQLHGYGVKPRGNLGRRPFSRLSGPATAAGGQDKGDNVPYGVITLRLGANGCEDRRLPVSLARFHGDLVPEFV